MYLFNLEHGYQNFFILIRWIFFFMYLLMRVLSIYDAKDTARFMYVCEYAVEVREKYWKWKMIDIAKQNKLQKNYSGVYVCCDIMNSCVFCSVRQSLSTSLFSDTYTISF